MMEHPCPLRMQKHSLSAQALRGGVAHPYLEQVSGSSPLVGSLDILAWPYSPNDIEIGFPEDCNQRQPLKPH
jgi:hypothetical protein